MTKIHIENAVFYFHQRHPCYELTPKWAWYNKICKTRITVSHLSHCRLVDGQTKHKQLKIPDLLIASIVDKKEHVFDINIKIQVNKSFLVKSFV